MNPSKMIKSLKRNKQARNLRGQREVENQLAQSYKQILGSHLANVIYQISLKEQPHMLVMNNLTLSAVTL